MKCRQVNNCPVCVCVSFLGIGPPKLSTPSVTESVAWPTTTAPFFARQDHIPLSPSSWLATTPTPHPWDCSIKDAAVQLEERLAELRRLREDTDVVLRRSREESD